jgi:uncharacterized protein YuzB (UPF0349 family)
MNPYVDWAKKNCARFCGYCGRNLYSLIEYNYDMNSDDFDYGVHLLNFSNIEILV